MFKVEKNTKKRDCFWNRLHPRSFISLYKKSGLTEGYKFGFCFNKLRRDFFLCFEWKKRAIEPIYMYIKEGLLLNKSGNLRDYRS